MHVLGIESSCDETAVAIVDDRLRLRAHRLHSQAAMHADYGGVVPELAARDHVRRIDQLCRLALRDAGLDFSDLDAVACTVGPGLAGALMVGAGYAAGVALARGLPLVGVHHMEAHLLAALLEPQPPAFPFVALLVSGGHSLLVEVRGVGRYQVLGQSIDDAVGEAFDKVASMLGLPYPGGPHLARLAERGDPERFALPRPMTDRPGLDFSFSGLKTAVLTALPQPPSERDRADMAASFQEAATQTLAIKCERALEQTGLRRLVVAGGVGANRRLRELLAALSERTGARLHFPRPELCTDNAAMVAVAGVLRRSEARDDFDAIAVRPRWPLDNLEPPP